jgi:hypothetical protein
MSTQNFLMRAFLRARFVMGSPLARSLILGNAIPLLGYSIQSFFFGCSFGQEWIVLRLPRAKHTTVS